MAKLAFKPSTGNGAINSVAVADEFNEQLWWANKINQFERHPVNSQLKELIFGGTLEKLPIW